MVCYGPLVPSLIDLVGRRFTRLLVLRRDRTAAGHVYWLCRCDCGGRTTVSGSHLKRGRIESCGCLHRERTAERNRRHGDARPKTPEYYAWIGAKGRCFNKRDAAYPKYGGRGIAMCEEWRRDFATFLRDMGRRPPGASLDRIDNDGPYAPRNCRWATRTTQNSNRRGNRLLTLDGRTMTLTAWAQTSGLTRGALLMRLKRGWPLRRALESHS